MRILYLSQRFPYPPDRGDRIPTFNHIKYLAHKHEVHVASLLGSSGEMRNVEALGKWVRSSVVEIQSPWKARWGMLAAWVSGQPLSLGYFGNERLARRVAALIEAQNIEAVIVFSSSMAQYAEAFGKLIRVMNFCDVDSQKWADLAAQSWGLKKWIYRREARLLLAYEEKIGRAFTASCLVTQQEARLFERLIPGIPVSVLANGVDHDYFGSVKNMPAGLQFTFVGVMDYEPNAEAAAYFVHEVWPQIRVRFPEARFNIVGSRPTGEVLSLAKTPGVVVTGFVEDVRTYLAETTMVIVPLKVARGIQNKILEAMAAGIPVLTTPEASGGLDEDAQKTLSIAERDPETFAAKLFEALANPEALREKARRARHYVRAHYSWEKTGEALEKLLRAQAPREQG